MGARRIVHFGTVEIEQNDGGPVGRAHGLRQERGKEPQGSEGMYCEHRHEKLTAMPERPARSKRSGVFGAALLVVASSCNERSPGPQDPAIHLAAVACDWIIACDCQGFRDEKACADRVSELYVLERAAPTDAGLAFDEACLHSIISEWDAQTCDPRPAPAAGRCADKCELFHGELLHGEGCRWHGNYHDCQKGLTCERDVDGVDRCAWPCGRREGEPCRPVEGPMCDPALDLVCGGVDPSTLTGTCISLPAAGELCPNFVCRVGDFCDTEGTGGPICRPLSGVGDPCISGGCGGDTFCDITLDEPVCIGAPMLGELCPLGWCAPDTYCDEKRSEPVCVREKEPGEPCAAADECRSDACDGGQCVAPSDGAAICEFARRLPPRPSL